MVNTERLLRELIALPSVNPAFLPVGDPFAGEKNVADFLAATAARHRLDVCFQKVSPGRSNVLAALQPAGKAKKRVILAPHLDTVNADPERFIPVKKAGRIHGRGACDTKGSVAAMFSSLCELASTGNRPAETEILFAGLVDEENAQTGSRAFAEFGIKADLAIVGEPTLLKVVTAHKGSLWLRLETHGKSAHGARPDLGKNAIHEMARAVDFLQTDYAALLKKRRHKLLGAPTVSVGTICGGTQPNIVPDRCEIRVDRRTLPGETERGVTDELKRLLRARGLSARIMKGKALPCDPMETNPALPLVKQCLAVARQKLPSGVHYFCDASVLAAGGIPSIVFGPGDIAQAHTADEWIDIQSVERAREILVRFLRSLP